MQHDKRFSNKWLVTLLVVGLFSAISLSAQTDEAPYWYGQQSISANSVTGFGSGPDLTAATISALSELIRNLQSEVKSIDTENTTGTRSTARHLFNNLLVIDTTYFMDDIQKGESEYYQTSLSYRQNGQTFSAIQAIAARGEHTSSKWTIDALDCTINDVLEALQKNGVDIKKQIVPHGAGYQFYLRLQMTIP